MRYALCFHDLRLSEGMQLPKLVDGLRTYMAGIPLTCHLIADADPDASEDALRYFRDGIRSGELELVFHGISHRCAEGTGKPWVWYHKNQAEFLGADFDAGLNAFRFRRLQEILGVRLGICPPCWIAEKAGWEFLRSLNPLFLEGMLQLQQGNVRRLSPVISLGSERSRELILLRIVARAIAFASRFFSAERLRLVVHPVDYRNPKSMAFLHSRVNLLQASGYQPVLQRDLL